MPQQARSTQVTQEEVWYYDTPFRYFPAGGKLEVIGVLQMATKTDKSAEIKKTGVEKPKRASKGMRTHTRRMKQEARKTAGTTRT